MQSVPAAVQALLDDKIGFLSKARLGVYDSKRNDPNADAVSGLSAYFHFGHLAPQRAALEAGKHRKTTKASDPVSACQNLLSASKMLPCRAFVYLTSALQDDMLLTNPTCKLLPRCKTTKVSQWSVAQASVEPQEPLLHICQLTGSVLASPPTSSWAVGAAASGAGNQQALQHVLPCHPYRLLTKDGFS